MGAVTLVGALRAFRLAFYRGRPFRPYGPHARLGVTDSYAPPPSWSHRWLGFVEGLGVAFFCGFQCHKGPFSHYFSQQQSAERGGRRGTCALIACVWAPW